MATVQFLQTFILVSIGLGSAIFILVSVMPSILPQAKTLAKKGWENMVGEVIEKGDDIMAGEGKASLRGLAKEVKEIISKATDLDLRIRDIRFGLLWGLGSAVAFLSAGLSGLYALSQPLIINSLGIIHSSVDPALDWFSGILFVAGLVAMLAFGISFFRIVSFYLKGELPSA